ncbi:MAG: NnrU family protein [Neomegalonema sp.]|nr:NnrU family protein [Neomegalonema sp.]
MIMLLGGIALFFLTHLIGLAPQTRDGLRTRLGAGGYRGLYALVSTAGLVLMIIGYRAADAGQLYYPPAWGLKLAHGLMPIAIILGFAAVLPSNAKRFVRHPMALGVLLWAIVHLINNGALADVILFGAFAVYALIDMFVLASGKPAPPAQPSRNDLILVFAGVVGYGVIFLIHTQLKYIGGPVFF